MFDQATLQAYRARFPKRASDAEFLNGNIYATDSGGDPGGGSPQDPVSVDPLSQDPRGLVDRIYRDRFGTNSVPTTRGSY